MRRDAITQPGYDRATVETLLDAVLARLPAWRAQSLVGLSGLQGSGKSTLARQITVAARVRGIPSAVLALDDFYLGRRARAALARKIHPLLATRGVPGTHDLALLERTLAALRNATTGQPARIPRFDKGLDTRVPPSRWRRIWAPPRLILLEGWCVAVPSQRAGILAQPANELERCEDTDARWRTWVNARLGEDYARLWQRLDALILLAAPDFSAIERWRGEAERALRLRSAPRAMSTRALARFLMHYERLSRHALRALPPLADIVVTLDATRRVRGIRVTPRPLQRSGSTTTAVP